MKKPLLFSLIALGFCSALHAQDAPGDQPTANVALKDPVAVVNGEKISREELQQAFKEAVEASGIPADKLPAEQKKEGYRQILNDMILDKLVTSASKDVKVTDKEIDEEIEKIKSQFPDEETFKKQLETAGQTPEKLREELSKLMQQRKWVEGKVSNIEEVTDERAQEYYGKNKEQFQEPEQVKASHILFRTEPGDESAAAQQLEKAKEAGKRAKAGEDFQTLAKELSEEPGAKERGGDLGFFTKERMVPEFANAAFSMEKNEISEPVKTQFGYHIIKVEDRKPERTVPFEEVKDQLKMFMKADEQRQAVSRLMDNLKKNAEITNSLEDGGSPQ